MKLTIALLIATAAVYVLIGNVASVRNYGVDVADRFIERLAYIPSKTASLLTRDNLAKWLADPQNASATAGYVAPILFPLDLLFLLLLGSLLGVASTTLVGELPVLRAIPSVIWWILPLLYLLTDLAEDALMIGIFRSVIPLTNFWFQVLHTLTAIKIASLTAAFSQVGFLGILCVLLRIFPASTG